RPETVESRGAAESFDTYILAETGPTLVTGLSVGRRIAAGRARLVSVPADVAGFQEGDVLVAPETDPDWGPLMSRAAAVVTDRGGRTSHAAIVSRELGIPAIVGTGDATALIRAGQAVTVDCSRGDTGHVYDGALAFDRRTVELADLPDPRTRVMVNLANPDAAFNWWRVPAKGVGLARIEFIIAEHIGLHPMAAARPEILEDQETRARVMDLARGHDSPAAFFVDRLARDIAKLAAFGYPDPVIVRTSDFKANEYGKLLGGGHFELPENNPMLGFRGASRYYSPRYLPGFLLECEALRVAREELGFGNIVPMIPFCRTLREADRVLEIMKNAGLERGKNGLEIYVMCEVPSNVVLAEEFAERFDGFSIGSNDLTQLALGVDRDSSELAHLFDERNEAVLRMIRQVIQAAHEKGRPVGICGQAPSDHPDFAEFLIDCGIDSISLNPDSVVEALPRIAEAEERRRSSAA
ncbi:MAG: phosphoenolpyruvate synthase, partial [Gemmatimonadetes bacterium]|nr:phosphoenolpyruvate synthase [Gemmatimonadota bacterium]